MNDPTGPQVLGTESEAENLHTQPPAEVGFPSALARHPIIAGAALGFLWGLAMRGWMRFISTDPEFSWAGTLFIVGASVLVGAALGTARHRRRRGGVGWWRLSMASLLLLGAGGAVMWPSVALGAIAFARSRPRWMRMVLVSLAAAAQISVLRDAVVDNRLFTPLEMVVATAWYVPLLVAEAWAFSVVFMPTVDGARATGWLKRVLIVAPVVGLVLFVVMAAGIPGM